MITTTSTQFPPTEVKKSLGLVGLESLSESLSVAVVESPSSSLSWSSTSLFGLQKRLARLRDFLVGEQQQQQQQQQYFDATRDRQRQQDQDSGLRQQKSLKLDSQQQSSPQSQRDRQRQQQQEQEHCQRQQQQEREEERNCDSGKTSDVSRSDLVVHSALRLFSVTQQQGAQEQQERFPAMISVPDEFYEIFKRQQLELC